MSELDEVLNGIINSLQQTSDAIRRLKQRYETTFLSENNSVSLLSLKSASMLAYINALMLVIGEKLNGDLMADSGRKKSIEHRIVLEKGVKPLEKKLSYQLDKLTRAYLRMEKEYVDSEKKATGGNKSCDEDGDSDSSEDEMAQRPHAFGVTSSREHDKNQPSVYQPPKVNPTLSVFEDRFKPKEHKVRSNQLRMQAVDEYLREESEKPEWESSIGANILKHGRAGVKSLRDAKRDREVERYEEDNFTRIKVTSKVGKRKEKKRERINQANMIGGEDFSIFSNKRKLEESTSRGSKRSHNAWEKVKKRL